MSTCDQDNLRLSDNYEVIAIDKHIVVQRDDFMKIHKLTSKSMEIRLGQDTINLSAIVGKPFYTAYKMDRKGSKRFYNLTPTLEYSANSGKMKAMCESGTDNRDINDDGASQKLTSDEIIELRSSGASTEKIVETLIENSKTFASKTEYSQEKYMKKKEKKYHALILIKKPTFRMIAESILRKNRILGLRMDTLAQLTTLASVQSGGSYMVYETGCQGLVTAAVLNAIGNKGTIIHVHNGNSPEKLAVLFMDASEERFNQILSVSVYHLLRIVHSPPNLKVNSCTSTDFSSEEPPRKKTKWEEREERAIEFLQERMVDGLLVVGKEHPSNLLTHLLKYLKIARPFVTFCGTREPLLDLFLQLKSESRVTALRLTESWLRSYQVLPERTHPSINMTGSGGCLLSGIKVSS